MRNYNFDNINDTFDYGRYYSQKLCDVLEDDPTYIHWCMVNIPCFYLSNNTIAEIQLLFPDFIIPESYVKNRIRENLFPEIEWDDSGFEYEAEPDDSDT